MARKWTKRELENLGVRFSIVDKTCIQISMPDWPRGETISLLRAVLQNDKTIGS